MPLVLDDAATLRATKGCPGKEKKNIYRDDKNKSLATAVAFTVPAKIIIIFFFFWLSQIMCFCRAFGLVASDLVNFKECTHFRTLLSRREVKLIYFNAIGPEDR